jgi:hypothetical protein
MRSRSGTKFYAVRDAGGRFKDIQTYKRAHAAGLRDKSKAEKEAARGPMEKKVRKTAIGVGSFSHELRLIRSRRRLPVLRPGTLAPTRRSESCLLPEYPR